MCYGFIYDILTSHLSANNLLHEYIHMPSLVRCAEDLTKCFHKAVSAFDHSIEFFKHPSEVNEDILYENNPIVRGLLQDQLIWDKFNALYPKSSEELEFAIQIAIDNRILRKTTLLEENVKRFCMNKLRILLSCVPSLHRDHTNKVPFEQSKSLGPVPYIKIANLRDALGLPISNWERQIVSVRINTSMIEY
jgi:hypothetical protein